MVHAQQVRVVVRALVGSPCPIPKRRGISDVRRRDELEELHGNRIDDRRARGKCRDSGQLRERILLLETLEAQEPEGLVLNNKATDRSAVLMAAQNVLGLAG